MGIKIPMHICYSLYAVTKHRAYQNYRTDSPCFSFEFCLTSFNCEMDSLWEFVYLLESISHTHFTIKGGHE